MFLLYILVRGKYFLQIALLLPIDICHKIAWWTVYEHSSLSNIKLNQMERFCSNLLPNVFWQCKRRWYLRRSCITWTRVRWLWWEMNWTEIMRVWRWIWPKSSRELWRWALLTWAWSSQVLIHLHHQTTAVYLYTSVGLYLWDLLMVVYIQHLDEWLI